MDGATPARLIKAKDLAANASALEELLDRLLPKSVRTVLDVRYGLGGWAKAVRDRFPKAEYAGWEADPDTAASAWTDGTIDSTIGRWTGPVPGRQPDLCLADFNVTTTKKRAELDALLAAVRPRYLIFTDVACVKLHLNFKAYGLESPDLNAYWAAFPVPGYRLSAFSKRHWAASTALYEKIPADRPG